MRQGTKVDESNDGLTQFVTAFGSFDEMCKAMDGGYVPTLRDYPIARPETKEGKALGEWNRQVKLLRVRVLEAGYPVYYDGKVHRPEVDHLTLADKRLLDSIGVEWRTEKSEYGLGEIQTVDVRELAASGW